MGYRIPERPIDPPERRLTADDIETLLEQTREAYNAVYGAGDLIHWSNPAWPHLKKARIALDEAVYSLEIARQNLEG
jgi:hypothetical protein